MYRDLEKCGTYEVQSAVIDLQNHMSTTRSLDHTLTLSPVPDNARTQDTVYILCDLLTGDIAYNIFTYSALKYSRTSVVSACPLKRVGGLFYRASDNVSVRFLWSRLCMRKHRQICFALSCSANASSPLLQSPSIRQSRCRWHRSIQ